METPQQHEPDAQQKSPEDAKADATKVVLSHMPQWHNWMTIPDEDVKIIKDELKSALGLPASENIIVSPGIDRGGMYLTVSSANNPLRRYLYVAKTHGADTPKSTKIDLKSSEGYSRDIETLILNTLKIPKELRVEISHSEDGDTTKHRVTLYKTDTELGVVEVDEKNARIVASSRYNANIEAAAPKTVKDGMIALGKDGRIRDIQTRKATEEALRSELRLPDNFANRSLFISGKQEGNIVSATIEDKESEQVIAEVEYDTEINQIISQKVLRANIRKIQGE